MNQQIVYLYKRKRPINYPEDTNGPHDTYSIYDIPKKIV